MQYAAGKLDDTEVILNKIRRQKDREELMQKAHMECREQ